MTYITVDGPMSLSDFDRSHHPRAAEWADAFVLSRERVGAAELGRYYRAVKVGDLIAVAPGICFPADRWNELTVDGRNLTRLRALALTARAPLVFGAESAAALWRLPMLGPWPARQTVFVDRAAGGRSTPTLARRCEGVPAEVWVVEGLATTGLARTVVDVARYADFGVAVAMADRALAAKDAGRGALSASVDRTELFRELTALALVHGGTKATMAIEFADGNSGSVGESLSRVVIHRLGFPKPVLQFVFVDREGRMIADFWWPDYMLIGEFDGHGKYVREEFTGGRPIADVVMEEKHRENRLRAQGPTVARWGWADAMAPPALRRVLLAAGLPVVR